MRTVYINKNQIEAIETVKYDDNTFHVSIILASQSYFLHDIQYTQKVEILNQFKISPIVEIQLED